MNLPESMKRMLGFLAVILSLLLGWSGSYWLTTRFYESIHYYPHELTRQLINSFLGFFLFGCCMFFITKIKWVKSQQDKFLHPMLHAMKMMAEGNFNIDLSFYRNQLRGRNDHPYQRLIESIHHMADKLGEMEGMRQEFISNVSHEIQSPLTSISGFAYALKNDELSPTQRKHYLEIIEMESNRLSKLSENLLKLTSLESDHHPFELKDYRLDHQLRRAILASEPQWAEKQIHLDISLEKLIITADEELMDQVWINLIHNSIKFTPKEGTISIKAFNTADNHRVIKIKDTGIGMNKEEQMHIFERFYKADKSRNRNFGGSGLGLSIVKRIIDLHKGEIQVQSEQGKGTEIIVRFWASPLLH
ncbi:HAMP domain-containing histidine kinase [Neobacillus drentensis]|uniref:sensor histidine kinase n=1 Tax=Neobacillus drentensis TaxID=220684 RepID=UPI001F2431E2|nr:HAMP domain-containing sensor histidine kinase [Neobacillus drentensis]ULT56648.1 HAMP domain-containing histidine kinase [Neobacillus drentensis]